MKPPRSECALNRSNPAVSMPASRDAVREDAAHGIRMQRRIADAVAGADAAEQRTRALRRATACQSWKARSGQVSTCRPRGRPISAPCPLWSVLPRRMRSLNPPATSTTSSTCSATSSDRRKAPAKPNSSSARSRRPAGAHVAGREQRPEDVERQRRRLRDRPSLSAQQPLERPADIAMRGVPGQVVEAVHLAEGGEPSADGGRREIGKAREIGADSGWGRRHRHEAHRRAPGRVMRPVGAVRPQGGRRIGMARERRRLGERGPPRLGRGPPSAV